MDHQITPPHLRTLLLYSAPACCCLPTLHRSDLPTCTALPRRYRRSPAVFCIPVPATCCGSAFTMRFLHLPARPTCHCTYHCGFVHHALRYCTIPACLDYHWFLVRSSTDAWTAAVIYLTGCTTFLPAGPWITFLVSLVSAAFCSSCRTPAPASCWFWIRTCVAATPFLLHLHCVKLLPTYLHYGLFTCRMVPLLPARPTTVPPLPLPFTTIYRHYCGSATPACLFCHTALFSRFACRSYILHSVSLLPFCTPYAPPAFWFSPACVLPALYLLPPRCSGFWLPPHIPAVLLDGCTFRSVLPFVLQATAPHAFSVLVYRRLPAVS